MKDRATAEEYLEKVLSKVTLPEKADLRIYQDQSGNYRLSIYSRHNTMAIQKLAQKLETLLPGGTADYDVAIYGKTRVKKK